MSEKGGTMLPGIPDLLTYLGAGWFLSDQFGSKKGAPAPAAQQPQAQPASAGAGAGAFVGAQRRAPMGPVALDWDIDEQTEIDVWRCIRDRNLPKAEAFARALSEAGLPVAAAAVSMHVLKLREAQSAAQAAQAVEVMHGAAPVHEPAPRPAPRRAPAPAPRAQPILPNGVPGNMIPATADEAVSVAKP
jgi:hypothetical protein